MAIGSRELSERLDEFMAACRRDGVSLTPQRVAIYRELASTDEHPDAETVHKRLRRQMPTVSLDTVYRTLALLERTGFARRVDAGGGSARYDANMAPHHHFVCTRCGLVQDFCDSTFDSLNVPDEARSIGDVTFTQVQLRGVCRSCKDREGES